MVMIDTVAEDLYGYVSLCYRPYYSPYARGLVSYDVYYSPYAFSYKNPSGLISAYGFNYWSWPSYQKPSDPEKSFGEMRKDYEEWLQMRQARIEKFRREKTGKESGKDIICRYLKGENIEFRLRNGFYIQNKMLSCEFLLKGGDVIKYWNQAAIAELTQQPEYAKIYQKYADNWMAFCKEYKGGKIYEIKFAN